MRALIDAKARTTAQLQRIDARLRDAEDRTPEESTILNAVQCELRARGSL